MTDPAPRSALARRIPGLLLLGVASYYLLWGGEYSAFDLRRLGEQHTVTSTRLAEARRQVDSLQTLATRLEGDPATIEQVARERFGMIRDGELLYRFVPVAETSPATDARVVTRTP